MREMNNNDFLREMGNTDFRHLTADKLVEFMSSLGTMDKDVAMKLLGLFPEYIGTVKEVVNHYKGIVDELVISNDKSMHDFYVNIGKIIDELNKLLDKDDLTFEERRYIMEQLAVIIEKMDHKDTENKEYLKYRQEDAGKILLTFVLVLGALFGLNYGVHKL